MKNDSGNKKICLICRFNNPQNTVFSSNYWSIENPSSKNLTGLYLLRAKRHVEHVSELTNSEAGELGYLLRKAMKMSRIVSKAKRVVASSMGFTNPHLHFWAVPVTSKTEKELVKARKAIQQFADNYRVQSPQ